MSSCFGERFRIVTFGESHGKAVGVVMDGVRPGLDFDIEAIQKELDRRRPGQSRLVTPRIESDRAEVLSGVFEGKTLGSPICLVIRNEGQDSTAYDELKDLFRPGHAGYTILKKYGIADHRGGGRSSGRETAARVAAGAFAKEQLVREGIRIVGYTAEIGGIRATRVDFDEIERNPLRCPDSEAAALMAERIEAVRAEGDSVGGIVEVVCLNVPSGLGEPVFDKLDAEIAKALMSIGGVKGVALGDGFRASRMKGSEHNDGMDRSGFTSNHAGGVLGGISTGQEIRAAIAVKPTPSISRPQRTVDTHGSERTISVRGRHDPCLCPRIVPVAEAMVALVLYDALLSQREIEAGEETLEGMRGEIDRIDRQLLELLVGRGDVSLRIGRYKKERGIPVRDAEREKSLLEERLRWAKEGGVSETLAEGVFYLVLEESRRSQTP
jgi:chorismate synthase